MALLNDFFVIEREYRDASAYGCRIRLESGHDVYGGHFPGMPVTPGACMLQMVEEVFLRQARCNMRLVRIANIKFLHVLTPGENPCVDIKLEVSEPDADTCKVKAVISDGEIVFAQLSLHYAPQE